MTRNNYWIKPEGDKWVAQKEKTERAAGVFDRQEDAEVMARRIMQNNGGGELITQNKEGVIRSKDTINAPDPNPPKDTEH